MKACELEKVTNQGKLTSFGFSILSDALGTEELTTELTTARRTASSTLVK